MSEIEPTSLTERILATLEAAGKNLSALTEHDLAPIDQFHNGGTWATRKLAALAGFPDRAHVLDIGGGVGGPARTLAREHGLNITVLDRSIEFCIAGATFTRMLGAAGQVRFIRGDALDLPVRDASVDAVLLQNAGMNIPNKPRLAEELFRVLRPGGRFAFQEVMQGPVEPVRYPTPWALAAGDSFLQHPDEARATLETAGFAALHWLDASDLIASWAKIRAGSAPGSHPLPSMTAFTMPDACDAAIGNMWRNAREGRQVTIWAVLEKPAEPGLRAGS